MDLYQYRKLGCAARRCRLRSVLTFRSRHRLVLRPLLMSENLLSIPVTTIKGEQKTLADYAGKAVLVVNTASKCGFTPQYKGLEKLWLDYKDKGLVVLGFPCNQFGKQEPGDEGAISGFCELNYGVSFPLFKKIDVNGAQAHPLFVQL
ncbi:Glutathione peroxidase, partial [Pseudomonas ficuserectae]